jgi:hypothetical protein
MLAALFRRAFSACLILLFSTGGGTLPVLDGLLFHSRDHGAGALSPHFEANGGHHADGCSIGSTAQQARFAPALGRDAKVVSVPESTIFVTLFTAPLPELLTGHPLSRAPPLFG